MSDVADKLMQQAVQARKEKRLADAKRDWAEAVELCRLEGMKRDLVAALKGLGQIERDMGHGDAALPLYEEAVASAARLGNLLHSRTRFGISVTFIWRLGGWNRWNPVITRL